MVLKKKIISGWGRNVIRECKTISVDEINHVKNFQKLKEKDLIIICDAGAYGYSLSSNYNSRPKPAEIMIKGRKIKLIQIRQKLADLI